VSSSRARLLASHPLREWFAEMGRGLPAHFAGTICDGLRFRLSCHPCPGGHAARGARLSRGAPSRAQGGKARDLLSRRANPAEIDQNEK